MIMRTFFAAALLVLVSVVATEPVPRATFTEVTNYGNNPTGTKMYLYVPKNLARNPAIVVGIHWCGGTATAYYQDSWWASYSETYGFIVIYPETPYTSDDCWDVASQAALTHGGGGDSNSIANMVTYTISQYSADPRRVFATGISSGAMMTNVLAAAYPDMFAAGIAYSGVPAGCFYSQANVADQWNMTCSTGKSIATQQQWANVVHDMYPGYSGSYPRMQIYHGDSDTALNVQNFYETIKQWTGIWGYSDTPEQTLANTPASPYTKYIYGPNVEGILGAGVGHPASDFPTEDLKWFGFVDNSSSTTTSAATSTTTTATTATTATSTTSAPSGTQTHYGQCGGIGWGGPTTCESPYTCTYVNDWYSQCL